MTTERLGEETEKESVWPTGINSLQFKASFLVVLLILAVATVGMILSLRAMSIVLYEKQTQQSREWATALASHASDAFIDSDTKSLQATCQELIKTLDVAYVVFTDLSGDVLASAEMYPGLSKYCKTSPSTTKDNTSIPPARVIKRGTLDRTYIDVMVPVYGRNKMPASTKFSPPILGYLQFGTDLSGTKYELHKLKRQITQTTILILLVAVPCCLLITRHMVTPLLVLARAARAIANGSMDARADIKRSSEIGELAESFNTMASRVAISQMELLELNAELEKRVQQRTQELEELAARDPLTGLYNRRHFGEQITREFAAAERYDADTTCLMFDLDHFKVINDKFGHRIGDELLILLSKAITIELRESDVAARFGGDEFILLLPQTSASAAHSLAERIVKRFTSNLKHIFPYITATLSVGIASLRTTQAKSAETLINEADLAMYSAKEQGRNRIMDTTQLPVHS